MESLNCPLCGLELCKPVTLPCGHSFCQACIRKNAVKKVIKCEKCIKYFHLKFLDFSVNQGLVWLLQQRKDLLFVISEKETIVNELKAKITEKNTRIENLEFSKASLESKLEFQINQAQVKQDQIDLQIKENKKKAEELEEIQRKLNEGQMRLVESEKKLEKRIQENLLIFNLKQEELCAKSREVQIKELLVDRKNKKFLQVEQKCEVLQKDLNYVLNAKQLLVRRRKSTEEIRDKSNHRPVSTAKTRMAVRCPEKASPE
jgi:hypothetical protein